MHKLKVCGTIGKIFVEQTFSLRTKMHKLKVCATITVVRYVSKIGL